MPRTQKSPGGRGTIRVEPPKRGEVTGQDRGRGVCLRPLGATVRSRSSADVLGTRRGEVVELGEVSPGSRSAITWVSSLSTCAVFAILIRRSPVHFESRRQETSPRTRRHAAHFRNRPANARPSPAARDGRIRDESIDTREDERRFRWIARRWSVRGTTGVGAVFNTAHVTPAACVGSAAAGWGSTDPGRRDCRVRKKSLRGHHRSSIAFAKQCGATDTILTKTGEDRSRSSRETVAGRFHPLSECVRLGDLAGTAYGRSAAAPRPSSGVSRGTDTVS